MTTKNKIIAVLLIGLYSIAGTLEMNDEIHMEQYNVQSRNN